MEKVILAYDGECFVCKELAYNVSHEFNAIPIPVQNLYSEYGLEHDAYLILPHVKYRGYSWLIPYIANNGLKNIFIRLLITSFGVSRKHRHLKMLGSHPIKHLGRGKMFLKLFTLFMLTYLFKPFRFIWKKIWG